ncbi:hypothetical protein EV702DRAFT_966381 [Suillus placidus]|uniref:Uncharacterized protein n=1 Tax=Suillus placidus TaxID=48579 RepID=A0A9P7D4P9_9AGAM|nr:hypothetical protein EV702DRAFT_966381 [Suillus placidus]
MSSSSYSCICKRTFTAQNYYIQHQHSCFMTKKRLSSAITSFKEFVSRRKKPCTSKDKNVVVSSPANPSPASEANTLPVFQRPEAPPPTVPLEVRDLLPESVGSVVNAEAHPALPVRTVFRTPPNIFGLICQYVSGKPASHDPEEYVTSADLSLISGTHQVNESSQEPPASSNDNSIYHPYPNCASFQLGDWYWNQGVQKSQAAYTKLMGIVGDSSFNAADVSSTSWKKINSKLGINEYNEGEGEEWEDEDAGWKKTPVSIKVPSSRTAEIPGFWVYDATHLYHCSLVAVLWEKLANPRDDKLFHYKPYKLRWAPPHLDAEVSIYGDLYTSPAFHEAHTKLQDSPAEPGCNLPRAVAGLMFWSDATQLTSFGNAKLWPTYMYFGNESKYRRCKPSLNLSNHVAYFEMVCLRICL